MPEDIRELQKIADKDRRSLKNLMEKILKDFWLSQKKKDK